MAAVETALVSSNGRLLIELDDGRIIDAGYVRGGQGPAGKDGADGAPGIPGAKGDPGTNGAQWHTGVGAPEVSLGVNGDLYMDVANSLLPIYQKVSRDWLLLCNLKVPPSGGGGGQAGAAGGGGSVILYPMPDGGKPPTTDNDGKPVDKGDIWLDLNTGWLWVYDGNTWIPVADRPPVIISPTPPEYNNASNEDPTKPPQYTVKDGDLWLDPSTNQLYIYRDGAWSEITACTTAGNETGPIDFPVGTDFPGDQIPDGHQHDNFYWDATLGAWKRVCGVSTQHCVLHYRSACTGGDTAWTGEAHYASVYEIQTEADEQDLNVKDVFEVKYTGQADYINVLDLDATEQARIGFDRVEDGFYYFTNTAEAAIKDSIAVRHVVTLEDEDGNVYECPTDIYRLVFTSGFPPHNGNGVFGHADVLCCFDFAPGDKRYLLAHGDNVQDCDIDPVYTWNKTVQLGTTQGFAKSYVSIGTDKILINSNQEIEVDAANSELNIIMDTGTLGIGSAHIMDFTYSGILYHETINQPKEITTKEYVDAADEILSNQIITLDEELESIVPSIERGQWTHEQAQDPYRNPADGKYFLIKGITASSDIGLAQFTEDYTEATGAVFSATDHAGTSHTWSDVADGELIDLLDKPDPDGLFGTITEINTTYHSSGAAIILWDPIKSNGSPTNNLPYLTNVKIFEKPTGGDASDFVKKTGDEMSGPLKFETAQNDTEYSTYPNQPRLIFENTHPDNGTKRTANIFQAGNTTTLVTNAAFKTKNNLYTSGYLYGWNGSSDSSYSPRIQLSTSSGAIKYINDNKLTWNSNGVTVQKGRSDSANGSGFIVKGKIHSSSWTSSSYTDANGDLLQAYHNANGQDAINYNGKITGNKNITTKEYVDSKLPTYIITKSNGNYYVS